MRQIAGAIQEGAKAYLGRQVRTVSLIAVVIALLVGFFKDWSTAGGFVLGAVCSLAAGFIGMRIAVVANVRTAQGATESRQKALRAAFNGGAVTGLLVVGLALLSVGSFWLIMVKVSPEKAVSSLVGVALGASLISVFARLGGGIYTKAADVGADLVGKVEQSLDEDDPRNPATIADNVGDNVGDCAGMAADVFETYAVSLIGAVLVAALTAGDPGGTAVKSAAVVYPFVLGGIAIIASIIGILYVNVSKAAPTAALINGVILSSLISAVGFYPVTHSLFPNGLKLTNLLGDGEAVYSANGIYYRRHHRFGDDRRRGRDHELLYEHALRPGSEDRQGKRDGARNEYHRGPRRRPGGHRPPRVLHRRQYLDEFSLRRLVRNRRRSHGYARHGRHHHLARCIRPDHRQCGRHCHNERIAQGSPSDHRRTRRGRQHDESRHQGLRNRQCRALPPSCCSAATSWT
jgi:hypothetical protein